MAGTKSSKGWRTAESKRGTSRSDSSRKFTTVEVRSQADLVRARAQARLQKEAKVCDDLSLMEKGGVIHELQIHPSFALYAYGSDGSKVKVCSYEADFQYIDLDKEIVLDVKGGVRTRMYSLKKKMMKACWGIEVQEA